MIDSTAVSADADRCPCSCMVPTFLKIVILHVRAIPTLESTDSMIIYLFIYFLNRHTGREFLPDAQLR